jgi:hypothetical protein
MSKRSGSTGGPTIVSPSRPSCGRTQADRSRNAFIWERQSQVEKRNAPPHAYLEQFRFAMQPPVII